MKESYGEGVASHTDPESCGVAREGVVEALTGARAGWVLSCERLTIGAIYSRQFLRDADAVRTSGRQHFKHRLCEMLKGPAQSETPCMYGNTLHENREVPCSPGDKKVPGRVGKSKDVRRR